MTTDPPKNTCSCEWCSIRRELAIARGEDRAWLWARLWKHYLEIVLNACRHVAKGEHIHGVTIDETNEIAGEHAVEFEAELDAWKKANP